MIIDYKTKLICWIILPFCLAIPLSLSAVSASRPPEIFLQLGHSSDSLSVSYSPDGRYIASGDNDNNINIWSAESGELLRILRGHTSWVNSVSYSPDGRYIASGSGCLSPSGSEDGDNTIKIWSAESGELLRTLRGHTEKIDSVSYSPDGRHIVSGSWDQTIKIWSTESGELLRELSGPSRIPKSVSYSPDGRHIASGDEDTTIKIWSAESGELLHILRGHTKGVISVSYSPDGKYIASGDNDTTIKIWSTECGMHLHTLSGHSWAVLSVSYSPDGRHIASGSWDNSIKIWSAESGELLRILSAHTEPVLSVSYSPDGRHIASASCDNSIKIWSAESGVPIHTLSSYKGRVYSMSYSPDGKHIASGNEDSTIKIWSAESGGLLRTLSDHTDPVKSVSYSPDGKHIASGSEDNEIKIWSAESGELLRTLSDHRNYVESVSYSPDGRYIASGSYLTIKIYSAESGELLRTLNGRIGHIESVSCSPDGRYIASGGDNNIEVWSAESGELFRTLSDHTGRVKSVSYSPDGRHIASASEDKTVKVWSAESGELLLTLSDHTESVESVSYSPDGGYIASASEDNTIKIWLAETGVLLRTLSGHTLGVWSVCYSLDGRHIASGSDNKIKIWSVDMSDKHTTDTNAVYQQMDIALLPGNDWLSWRPGCLFYNSSLHGDEYAALRFENRLYPVYPLEYYRHKLKRPDWFNDTGIKQPCNIVRRWNLWWEVTLHDFEGQVIDSEFIRPLYEHDISRWSKRHKKWIWCSIFAILTLTTFGFLYIRRSDPFVVYRQFFKMAGFKGIRRHKKGILLLYQEKDSMTGVVLTWQGEKAGLSQINVLKRLIKMNECEGDGLKIYIVYDVEGPPAISMQDMRNELKCEIIPLDSSRLNRAIAKKDKRSAREELRVLEEPFLIRIDPYAESKPIHDKTWFFGRDELMRRIPSLLAQRQHVGIFGLRKVGKTSLIRQIQLRFITTAMVYIDCQCYSPNAQILFEEILNQLRLDLDAHGIKDLPKSGSVEGMEGFRKDFLALFEKWKKTGQSEPVIIIMDEIDKLFPKSGLKGSESILAEYIRFFKTIRGLAQSLQCLVVLAVAYRPDVNKKNLLSDLIGENPMFKSYMEEYLGFLSRSESTKMIKEIGGWKGIVWETKAAERAFYYCGGHPLVTRYFASDACDKGKRKEINYKVVENTAERIKKTFRTHDIGDYYANGVWDVMTPKEQEIMELIFKADGETIKESKVPADFEEALSSLERFGLVRNDNSMISFTSELFRAWLKRRFRL